MEGVCVVYMSMDGVSEESGQAADIVYQFPDDENVLTKLRGSFYTLEHLLNETTDSDVRT